MKNIHLLRTNLSRLYYSISMSGYNLKLSAIPYHQSSEIRPQHLYITSDEEIKEGDKDFYIIANDRDKTWINHIDKVIECKIDPKNGKVLILSSGFIYIDEGCKIILTTDQLLDGVQPIDDEFLEWFVNNSEVVGVEVEKEYNCPVMNKTYDKPYINYKIIIPKEEPKDVVLGYKTSLDAKMLDKVEPKQETTLEEIAKKVYPDNIVQLSPTFFHNTADIRRHDFIQGYNLHKGELYSEEEVKDLIEDWTKMASGLNQNFPLDKFNIWFEQFKK